MIKKMGMATRSSYAFAVSVMTVTVLMGPLEVRSQPRIENSRLAVPSIILSLQQSPLETLSLLQGLSQPDHFSGAVDILVNSGTPRPEIGGIHSMNLTQSQIQNINLKHSSTVVWSDNRGTWKSDPPGGTCMLLSISHINSEPCN